jgi:hypothetical protein
MNKQITATTRYREIFFISLGVEAMVALMTGLFSGLLGENFLSFGWPLGFIFGIATFAVIALIITFFGKNQIEKKKLSLVSLCFSELSGIVAGYLVAYSICFGLALLSKSSAISLIGSLKLPLRLF